MKRLLREFLNSVLILLGIFSAYLDLKGFLLSSNFIGVGVTGVSMLLAKTTGLPLVVLLPLVTLPFIAFGYRRTGRASSRLRDWPSFWPLFRFRMSRPIWS